MAATSLLRRRRRYLLRRSGVDCSRWRARCYGGSAVGRHHRHRALTALIARRSSSSQVGRHAARDRRQPGSIGVVRACWASGQARVPVRRRLLGRSSSARRWCWPQLRFPAAAGVHGRGAAMLLVTWLLLGRRQHAARVDQRSGRRHRDVLPERRHDGARRRRSCSSTTPTSCWALLTLAGGVVPSLVPSIRTAVAYPLANKFRTGMTIAMISLVMFALVMMSTMNANFDRIFLSDDALGGYDVVATENPGNPIDDLQAGLSRATASTPAASRASTRSTSRTAPCPRSSRLDRARRRRTTSRTSCTGSAPEFIATTGSSSRRAPTGSTATPPSGRRWPTNPDVRRHRRVRRRRAAASAAAAVHPRRHQADGPDLRADHGQRARQRHRHAAERARSSASSSTEAQRPVRRPADESRTGVRRGLRAARRHRCTTSACSRASTPATTAKGIEKTLLFQGVQADSLRKIIDDFQAQSRGFLYLIQGFMGIGLFVGIAAVGVIAFRTVVERRQQIGMLRAIGYTRRAVALSFLMESSFTALLGIASGIGLGLLLAYQLVSTDEFVPGGVRQLLHPVGADPAHRRLRLRGVAHDDDHPVAPGVEHPDRRRAALRVSASYNGTGGAVAARTEDDAREDRDLRIRPVHAEEGAPHRHARERVPLREGRRAVLRRRARRASRCASSTCSSTSKATATSTARSWR